MSLDITPVSVEGTEDVALPSSGAFFFHSNAAMWSSELYVVETEWEENSRHWAACDVCRERGRRQPSAFPGDIPTSFVTDSRGMANDSLDCHNHRYHDHENHQQGSNYGP